MILAITKQSLVLFVEIFPGVYGTPAAGNKRSIIFTWLGQFWGQEFVLRRYEPSLILTHFTPLKIPPPLKLSVSVLIPSVDAVGSR